MELTNEDIILIINNKIRNALKQYKKYRHIDLAREMKERSQDLIKSLIESKRHFLVCKDLHGEKEFILRFLIQLK